MRRKYLVKIKALTCTEASINSVLNDAAEDGYKLDTMIEGNQRLYIVFVQDTIK